MSRKKTQKKQKKVIKQKVEQVFDCPFCNYTHCIECKLTRKIMKGNLYCRVCGITFQTNITELSAPVDVYCDFIDECEKENPAKAIKVK